MIDPSVEAVSNLVGLIYEAGYDQSLWPGAMAGLRDMVGGSRCCVLRFNAIAAEAVASEPDPDFNSPRAAEELLRDPLLGQTMELPIGVIQRWPPGEEEAAFRRRDAWQDWFRPRDLDHWLACNLFASNGSSWLLNMHRSSRQGGFANEEIDFLQKVMPHVQRAGQIGQMLENTSVLASAFSHLPFGVLLVTGRHRLVTMNEAAEALLSRAASPVTLHKGYVASPDAQDTGRLHRLIEDCCPPSDGAIPGPGGTLLIPSNRERLNQPRLVLSVAPFPGARAYGLAVERCAVIVIRQLAGQPPQGFDSHVRALFDLTPAEARLAAALAAGRTLKDAALDAGITIKTGRTYLDRIFTKTRTHQQSELVALLKSTEPLGRP